MKKKLLSYVLSMVLLLTLLTWMMLPASASASADLSVANIQAKPGDTVVVDVTLNGVAAALQITLEYDPEVLTPEKIESGPQCPSGWLVVPSNDLTKGHFLACSFKNETIVGIVARYTYKVNSSASLGVSSLKVATAIMTDALSATDAIDFNAAVLSHGSVAVVSSSGSASSDATLSELKINNGTVTLSPTFSSNEAIYTATVNNSVERITVTASPYQAGATVVGTGEKSLDEGVNIITITVTAEDKTTKDYVIIIIRNSRGSGLSVITSSSGITDSSEGEDINSITTPLSALLPFIDVNEGDWFYNDVYYMWENDLMNGTLDTLFSPNGLLTRGMVVTVLYRMENKPSIAELDNPFTDVVAGKYYTEAVIWAADKEIVLGYGDGTYKPDRNVTREEFAAILYRYEQNTGKIPTTDPAAVERVFADAGSISGYAKVPVKALVMQGIINGKPNNMFDPKGNATRAEFAAMLHRYLVAIAEE